MEVISEVWRSELGLHQMTGATLEHHPTYVVSRPGPDGPEDGLVLLRRAPLARDAHLVVDLLRSTFPHAPVLRLGVDDPQGRRGDLRPLADLGFTVALSRVLTMTSDAVEHDPAGDSWAEIRPLATAADWADRTQLRRAALGESTGLARDAVEHEQVLAATGRATWLGAFDGAGLLATVGLVSPTPEVALLQDVEVPVDARHRGLAAGILAAACRHARSQLGASTLMVVADPDHPSIGRFERLGFRDSETQLQASVSAERLRSTS
ncbi:hypothetical protein BH11ACT8_BH11ACT8_31120 [soil metagenome]